MALGAYTPVHSTLAAPLRPAPQLSQDVKRLNKLVAAGQYGRADRDAAKLLKRHPKHPGLLSLRGYVALVLGKPDQGLTWADRALGHAPQDENAQVLAADCLLAVGHREAACQRLRAALAANDAWRVRRKLAQILTEQQHHLAALDVLQAGLSAKPNAEMMEHIGRCLQNLHRYDEAANAFEIGMRLDPSHKPNFFLRAILAQKTKGADPRVYLLQVLQADPADTYAIAQFLWASRGQCDWSAYEALAPADLAPLRHGDRPSAPWYFLPLVDDPKACQQHQRQMQASHLARLGWKRPERAPLPPPSWDSRIRVGYYSSDFYDHATLRLFAGVLRHHDRRTFEIHCFDYGQNDHLTEQALRDVEHVHSIHGLSDSAVTTHARRIGLDIAVDLKGDTIGARSDLMLRGQAPVQINYLGYPGTMGSRAYDYVIADHVVLPPALESAFDEHVIRLPTCYLPSDDRVRPRLPPTRAEVGLPDTAMVLACLNDPYKITPSVFDIWMRTLAAHPNTVLWLLDRSGDVRQNLI
ncbi:MAG: tetratricopeptide repeat protein, partial [Pseudomonadota bacterium]